MLRSAHPAAQRTRTAAAESQTAKAHAYAAAGNRREVADGEPRTLQVHRIPPPSRGRRTRRTANPPVGAARRIRSASA
ncbi:MAG TPA: hypothetical protein VIT41_15305, partial [Microlunatus sp.]